MSSLQRLFHELKRRKVFRVAGVYALVAWGVIEVAETTAPLMGLPPWDPKLVLFLAILGLPIALVLAWALEVTPEGVKRTESESSRTELSRVPGIVAMAILLALAGFGAYAYWGGPEAAEKDGPITSIAVLPFANMSSDPEQEYFSDGITEELLDALAQLGGLCVPARTSSFAFKGKDTDIREIAEILGVEAVLEGSVRKAGDQVRITAQLFEAEGGYHLWSEVYERRLTDIFAVQDEITQAIIAALEVQLEGADSGASLVSTATNSPEAYNEYLLGRYHWNRRSEAAITTAIRHFERALALDPRLASAHAGLAGAYSTLGYYNYLPADDAFERGRSAAELALELDASSAEAYAALGYIHTEYDWDWDGAEEAFRRAIEQRGLAVYGLARSGQRDEAERQYRELRNSRDQPGTAFWLAVGAVGLERSDEAFQWLEAAYRERCAFMAALAVEPLLKPLQTDPRFRPLLGQVGL